MPRRLIHLIRNYRTCAGVCETLVQRKQQNMAKNLWNLFSTVYVLQQKGQHDISNVRLLETGTLNVVSYALCSCNCIIRLHTVLLHNSANNFVYTK